MAAIAPAYPIITLITVVRNGAKTIERCLESVAAQDYPHLEYLLYDAASMDGTQAIIERYASMISHYKSEPDDGPYDAITQALSRASGNIIGFLYADDWLSPGALQTIAEMHQQNPHVELFCFGMQVHVLQLNGAIESTHTYLDPDSSHFLLQDGLYCQGVNRFYARSIIQQEGYFKSAQYKQLADREFYMRLGLRGTVKAWSPKILYHFLVHPGSNSTGGNTAKIIAMHDETIRIAKDYLALEGISPTDRKHLIDWQCFLTLRNGWYLLKAKKPWLTVASLIQLAIRYPLRTIRAIIHWRMPAHYRRRVS